VFVEAVSSVGTCATDWESRHVKLTLFQSAFDLLSESTKRVLDRAISRKATEVARRWANIALRRSNGRLDFYLADRCVELEHYRATNSYPEPR